MERMEIIILAILFSLNAHASQFWDRNFTALDPNDGVELVQELELIYPEPSELRPILFSFLFAENKKTNRNLYIINALKSKICELRLDNK